MEAQAALHRRLPKLVRTSTDHLVLLVAGRLEQQGAQIELAELATIPPKTCGAQVVVPLAPEGAANLQARQRNPGDVAPEVAISHPRNPCLPSSPETRLREPDQGQLASAEMAS